MFVKIGLAVAVALVAFAPSASFAASKKPKGEGNEESCLGGGCHSPNPNRVQTCPGGDPTSCYKRTRRHKGHSGGHSGGHSSLQIITVYRDWA
jgi:hypothetical protein